MPGNVVETRLRDIALSIFASECQEAQGIVCDLHFCVAIVAG